MKPGNFYGVDGNFFKVNDDIYEVVEDESDGYRSALKEVRYVTAPAEREKLIFSKTPIAVVDIITFNVRKRDTNCTAITNLVDKSGHIWLEYGTENYDDYYPCFVFRYSPSGPHDND